VQERHDIFVRAHAPLSQRSDWRRKLPEKWPKFALIFDTETTLDPTQKLTFGCFRRCELVGETYRCIEEGLFHADATNTADLKLLEQYVGDPARVPNTQRFPPQIKLRLMTRTFFIDYVFWRAVRRGDLIVGFNLPFDLSRLAIRYADAKKGGWSLVLSLRKSRNTGQMEVNPERPRIVITALNSKMAFIRLSSNRHRDEWPNDPRFLDLRTTTWALRNEPYSLERACNAFNVSGKLEHKPTGKITLQEINYCRQDVAATHGLLNAAMKEFDRHPIALNPDGAYSPASIAKAYLNAMNIRRPKSHFKVSGKAYGIAMQSYYGGRAECRIRKIPVPVVHTDFTSQYPTVNALLGNWDVLKASRVRFEDCTRSVRRLLPKVRLPDTFTPEFWKELAFFVLIEPEKDILPVRTVYNGRTLNIGINYLTSREPVWYAGPDVVAAVLLTGKRPKVVKAVRMVSSGQQHLLRSTNLGGTVPIDPRADDFFVRVIEQRSVFKRSNKSLADFLKVVGNSGSYGLFVQVDSETRRKAADIRVFSGEHSQKMSSEYVEKPGPWYFPPIASLITAGGRLLLAVLEKCILDAHGSYLFCDTDSMCIVATKKGALVPCDGGKYKLHGKPAIRALSINQVESIAKRFNRLNPYDRSLVHSLLKIEDVNFVDSNPRKPHRQLFGYAVAAKRYVLYTKSKNDISIVKASGHGLGYLFAPKENPIDDGDAGEDRDEVPRWVVEAWDWLLRKELGFKPKEPDWLDLPAMMRMVMTSPNVMRTNRPEWLAPFNFFLFPLLSDLGGYPAGFDRSNFRFITPPESDRQNWKTLKGINLLNGRSYQISMMPDMKQRYVVPESMRIILRQYLRHPEAKSLAPGGTACVGDTQGVLQRASILVREIVPVGKETDRRWEQGEDPSMLDFKLKEYRKGSTSVIADTADRKRWASIGVRELMRRSKLSQKAVYAIVEGKPVRRQTLKLLKQEIDGIVG
jgi:hypothetical protein